MVWPEALPFPLGSLLCQRALRSLKWSWPAQTSGPVGPFGAAAHGTLFAEEKSRAATNGRTSWEESLRPDIQKIHQQSHERTRGRGSTGLKRLSEKLDHSLDPPKLGLRNSHHWHGICLGSARCMGSSARCHQRARAQQNRCCVTSTRQIGAHECSGTRGRTYLDAIFSFAGAGQRRGAYFGDSAFSQLSGAICDSPNECRFLLNTQVMFLKKEKDPTTKLFDDEEWIRSSTEAQEITVDIQENVTTPTLMGEFLRKYVSRRPFALNEG